jgi:hypothetical protein
MRTATFKGFKILRGEFDIRLPINLAYSSTRVHRSTAHTPQPPNTNYAL